MIVYLNVWVLRKQPQGWIGGHVMKVKQGRHPAPIPPLDFVDPDRLESATAPATLAVALRATFHSLQLEKK
jgi:hypothetical protein